MEVRRITGKDAFIQSINEIKERVQSVETRPAGNIVIRETLKTTDPVTGVETIVGKLPDGSYGFQPFIGDTTPPPVATTPSVSAQPGVIVVSWDGQFVASAPKPRDFEYVNVWGHKYVSGSEVSSQKVGLIRVSTETLYVSTDVIAIDETWKFSLESEDYNGNVAAKSTQSSLVTMESNLDSGVTQAIIDSANGMNSNYYQPSMPTGGIYHTNDLWFDTDDGFKMYVYSGGAWTASAFGHQAVATLDAGKIVVGEMDGVFIKSKSILTDRLVITSTDNLVIEANFNNSGTSWGLGTNNSINATAGRGSLPAMRFTGTTSAVDSVNLLNKVPVGTEDRFRGAIWAKSSAALTAGSVLLKARAYTDATTYTSLTIASNGTAFVASTWKNISGISPTLPSGTISLEFYLEVINDSSGTTTDIDYVSVTRAADASLVVDGAIDGKTITGATVQTAASGARIVLDQTSLNAYDASSNNYFSVTSASGVSIGAKSSGTYITRDNWGGTDCSFESGLGQMTVPSPFTGVRDTAQAYLGTYSLKLTDTSSRDRSAYALTNYSSQGVNTFSIYVRHNSSSSRNFRIDYSYWDLLGTQYGSTVVGTPVSVSANTWTRVTVTTAPTPSFGASAPRMQFSTVGIGMLSTETIWLDAFMLENSSTAGSFFDANTTPSGGYTYPSTVYTDLPFSRESFTQNVTIKTGPGVIKAPDAGNTSVPSIGFILDTPLTQGAGLISNGQYLGLLAGGGSAGASIYVGKGSSANQVSISANDNINIDSLLNMTLNPSGKPVYANGRQIGFGSYVEFRNSQTGVPNATVWGVGTPTVQTRSTDTGIAHASGSDQITFDKGGIYTIAFTYNQTVGATGRTFCQFGMSANDSIQWGRSNLEVGEDTGTTTVTARVNAGEVVVFGYYQTTGGSVTANTRIRITRVSDI